MSNRLKNTRVLWLLLCYAGDSKGWELVCYLIRSAIPQMRLKKLNWLVSIQYDFSHYLGSSCPPVFHLWIFIKSSNWDQIDAVVLTRLQTSQMSGAEEKKLLAFTQDSSYHSHLCHDLIMFPSGTDVHVTLVIITNKRDLQRQLSPSHSRCCIC